MARSAADLNFAVLKRLDPAVEEVGPTTGVPTPHCSPLLPPRPLLFGVWGPPFWRRQGDDIAQPA